jgi:type VI secretion system secreted protein VgrG
MAITATLISQPLAITTALDKGSPPGVRKFVAREFHAEEAISRLFRATVDVVTDKLFDLSFDQLLGSAMLVELPGPKNRGTRYFHGICHRISQSDGDANHNHFRFELVPRVWLLTKRSQSRIFQQTKVPDILSQVLAGMDFAMVPADLGKFELRDYCVQYRETDWDFAARLMEDEGIFFFFRHSADGHQLVLANSPGAHQDVPFSPRITLKSASQAAAEEEDFVTKFDKAQEISTGKVTLWDHNFELPHKHLEAEQQIQESVPVGLATHKLKFGENGKLEMYDWPGLYAERFDGVSPGGADRPADLQKIFEDNQRTAGIRMQQAAARALEIRGASTARQLIPGFKFTLTTLPGDPLGRGLKADGVYVVTSVEQTAHLPDPNRSGAGQGFRYANTFTAIPIGLPFRPMRATPRPVVPGSQTAVVCGPKGQEIFTDKYGRVKVQFHWDREGKYDASSSCWVRVATYWAGRQWGAVHIPRIGQEVIVDFLEGDPDRPIIVGSVYNADQMPPYKLPENQTRSGIKSNSSLGGHGSNEIHFEDKKGHEDIYVHAQRTLNTVVEASESRAVGWSRTTTVHKGEKLTVDEVGRETVIKKGPETLKVEDGKREVWVSDSDALWVQGGDAIRQVDQGNDTLVVKSKDAIRQIDQGNDLLTVKTGEAWRRVPNGDYTVLAKKIYLLGKEKILLKVGNSSIEITPDQITINSQAVLIDGGRSVKVNAEGIDLN